jgi:hypothetical protein
VRGSQTLSLWSLIYPIRLSCATSDGPLSSPAVAGEDKRSIPAVAGEDDLFKGKALPLSMPLSDRRGGILRGRAIETGGHAKIRC